MLQSQRLTHQRSFGKGPDATLKVIEHLGYVQIDTLSVVARAHLHTLWNRVNKFDPEHIEILQTERKIFEHWSHALAFLPMKDFRFSLPMMNRIAKGETNWYSKNSKLEKFVLKRIREEGPLSAKDFNDKKSSKVMWARSPSKKALEQLFIEGKLMIPRRLNFHKVYDLRERVLPVSVDVRLPDDTEFARFLITGFLRAHGLGQPTEIAYLRKGLTPLITRVASEMQEEGLVMTIKVLDQEYYCLPSTLELLDKPASRNKIRILSPFDNAIIQRRRVIDFFDFDYKIECYVPRDKRLYGYFCLPVLWNNKLVARIDAKASRKYKLFHIFHLHIEETLKQTPQFISALTSELKKFMAFNNCNNVYLHKISRAKGKSYKSDLKEGMLI